MGIIVKEMETEAEIRGKGLVHWKSWQETYQGLVDRSYLEGHTPEKCIRIAFQWPDHIFVAKDGEKVVGFVGYGGYRDDTLKDTGEIFALYVLEEYHRRKIGSALMSAALEELNGYSRIALWVLQGNEKAIAFYEHAGFRFDGTAQEITLGTPNTELRMVWERQPST